MEQGRVSDRLTLAIPIDEILAYYESRILRDVIVVKHGLIMRMAIPLATNEAAFTVFCAVAVPMLKPENDMGSKSKLEVPFFRFFKKNDDTAFLTEYDLSRCIGSTRYQICLDMIATEAGHE